MVIPLRSENRPASAAVVSYDAYRVQVEAKRKGEMSKMIRSIRKFGGAVVVLALGLGLFAGSAGAQASPPPPPSVFTPPPAAPRNDAFANPVVLSPDPSAFNISPIAGDIRYATRECGEPNHARLPTTENPLPRCSLPANPSAHQSVWYRWTAPRTEVVEFNTCNSHFDTELGIYTGVAVSGLTPVVATNPSSGFGQNDDAEPFDYCGATFPYFFNSRVVFRATAGTTYRIAVDGYYPSGYVNNSTFVLNYRYCPPGRLQGCLGPIS